MFHHSMNAARTGWVFPRLWMAVMGWVVAAALPCSIQAAAASQFVHWNASTGKISANVENARLEDVLQMISETTRWQVYVDPEANTVCSAAFQDRNVAEALKLLIGDLSYALIPQPNAPSKLMIFRNAVNEASRLVSPRDPLAKPIPNELIVKVKPGTDIEALAKKWGAKVKGKLEELNTYRLEFESAEAAARAREELAKEPQVESIESNYPVNRPPPSQDVQTSSLPELTLQPQSPNDCGTIKIAQLDTNFPVPSGNLEGFFLPSINVTESAATSGTPEKPPHGSSIAATILRGYSIASQGKTTAPIRILPVDVFGGNAQASTFDLAKGVYRAVNAGAKIINMSLGSYGSNALLADVIAKAHAQDVVIIAAAGNEPVTNPTFPAAYSSVIAVTAGDSSGRIANYANRGDFVDVIAPGSSVFEYNGQRYLSTGTSISTAYVSGLAAALADPCNTSYSSVEAAIRKNLALRK